MNTSTEQSKGNCSFVTEKFFDMKITNVLCFFVDVFYAN